MTLMQAYAQYCYLEHQYDVVAEDLMWSLDPTYCDQDLSTIHRKQRELIAVHPDVVIVYDYDTYIDTDF